jgi:triacylglycerol lipase
MAPARCFDPKRGLKQETFPMSVFVELDEGSYPANALDKFSATEPQFSLDNARAMMWLSQLAYETAHEKKVGNILDTFKLTRRGFGSNDPGTGLPPHSACFVVARTRRNVRHICG